MNSVVALSPDAEAFFSASDIEASNPRTPKLEAAEKDKNSNAKFGEIDLAEIKSPDIPIVEKLSDEGVPLLYDAFEVFPDKWRAKVAISAPFYTFYLGQPKVDGVAFLPNFNPELGISIGYKGYGLKMSQPFQILPDYESSKRGESIKEEYIFSVSLHRFAVDLYSQYYRGFYISTPLTSLNDGQPSRFAQLPDTQVHNAGINIYYSFHRESYSMEAAFSNSEFQFKSGGSPLAHIYLNRLDLNPGSQFIAGSAPGAAVRPEIFAGTFWSAGAAAGYGYTHSFRRYFLSGQAMVGIGPQYQFLNDKTGSHERFSAQVKWNSSIAFGMNRRSSYAGIQALLDSIYGQIQDGQLASSLVSTLIYYGRRF